MSEHDSDTRLHPVLPSSGNTGGRLQKLKVPGILVGLVLLLALGQGLLLHRAESNTNHVAMDARPLGVTVVRARASKYQAVKRYVGNVEPWLEAKLGPQAISAYVREMNARPGDAVKRGMVLAKLDCRSARARADSSSAQAEAMRNRLQALSDQASRIETMAQKGFMPGNEAQMKLAESQAEKAKLEAARADLRNTEVVTGDCALVAPFDGDVFTRDVDPGAFLSPGKVALTLVDRSKVRITLHVPESDFDLVPPGSSVQVTLLATQKTFTAPIARRAPAVDPTSRTVQVEVDLDNPGGNIPVHTTASVEVNVGVATEATAVPLIAATVKRGKATLFTAEGGKAHLQKVKVVGERDGELFVESALVPGAWVVTEGRGLLEDGQPVSALET